MRTASVSRDAPQNRTHRTAILSPPPPPTAPSQRLSEVDEDVDVEPLLGAAGTAAPRVKAAPRRRGAAASSGSGFWVTSVVVLLVSCLVSAVVLRWVFCSSILGGRGTRLAGASPTTLWSVDATSPAVYAQSGTHVSVHLHSTVHCKSTPLLGTFVEYPLSYARSWAASPTSLIVAAALPCNGSLLVYRGIPGVLPPLAGPRLPGAPPAPLTPAAPRAAPGELDAVQRFLEWQTPGWHEAGAVDLSGLPTKPTAEQCAEWGDLPAMQVGGWVGEGRRGRGQEGPKQMAQGRVQWVCRRRG
jgi:hypothetical protein